MSEGSQGSGFRERDLGFGVEGIGFRNLGVGEKGFRENIADRP